MSDAPRHAVPRLEAWRTRWAWVSDILTPQRIGLGLLALVLLVAGAFGGWEDALTAEETTPRAEPGATVAAAPFDVVVRKAFQGDALPPVANARDGVRYLFVTLDVTNTSDAPVFSSILSSDLGVDLTGVDTTFPPQVFRINDTQGARSFSPDVTVPVVVVWELDASLDPPTEVTLTVPRHTWRRASLDSSMGWRDPEPAVEVTLPVAEVPAG